MESIVVLKYPLGTETITFDQLLEWELWPCFIKIFSETFSITMYHIIISLKLRENYIIIQESVRISMSILEIFLTVCLCRD